MSKRKVKSKASEAAVAIVECPTELSAAARKEWDKIVPALAAEGRLTVLDRPTLAILCSAFADWIAANEALQNFGTVMKSPSGYPVQSPYVSITAKHADTVIRLAAEFGPTPASRRRIPSASNHSSWIDDIPELDDSDLTCPIHQGSSNFEVWRSFLPLAATIRGAARGAHLDFVFNG